MERADCTTLRAGINYLFGRRLAHKHRNRSCRALPDSVYKPQLAAFEYFNSPLKAVYSVLQFLRAFAVPIRVEMASRVIHVLIGYSLRGNKTGELIASDRNRRETQYRACRYREKNSVISNPSNHGRYLMRQY